MLRQEIQWIKIAVVGFLLGGTICAASAIAIPQSGAVVLTIRGGANFVNLPLTKAGGALFKASEILTKTGGIAVAQLRQRGAENTIEPNQFRIFIPGFSPADDDFDIEPQKGYVVLGRDGARQVTIAGQYSVAADTNAGRRLAAKIGPNLAGFPAGIPHMATWEDIRTGLGRSYIVRTVPDVTDTRRTRFQIALAGLNPDYTTVAPGEACYANYGVATAVDLPYEGNDGFGYTVTTVGRTSADAAVPSEGAPASSTAMNAPESVKALDPFDPTAVLYSDTGNHCIRRTVRNQFGELQAVTVAGKPGIAGFRGDGGSATDAELREPRDMTFDRFGNILFADRLNHRVRMLEPRIDFSGKRTYFIKTVAGQTIVNPDATSTATGDGLPATQFGVELNRPEGVVIKRGPLLGGEQDKLYISNSKASEARVRIMSAPVFSETTAPIINTYAGRTGTVLPANQEGFPRTDVDFGSLSSLSLDVHGNLLVADALRGNVRRVTATDGNVYTMAGSGVQGTPNGGLALTGGKPATEAAFLTPKGLVGIPGQTGFFVADAARRKLARVGGAAHFASVVGGDGTNDLTHVEALTGPSSELSRFARTSSLVPYGIDIGAGEVVHFADQLHNRIRRVTRRP